MTIEEQSEQSYTEIGHYVAANDAEELSLVDTRTGDFTETYREELQRTPNADKDAKQMEKLIRRQAKRVQTGRRVFVACTLVAGLLVSTGAFLSLSKLQQTDSTERYRIASTGVQHVLNHHFDGLTRTLEGLSEAVTAAALKQNETFPFVTVNLFEVVGRYARRQSSSDLVAWSPLVAEDKEETWMNFSRYNAWWVEQSHLLESSLGSTTEGLSEESMKVQPLHFPPNYFLPVWQTSPIQPNATSLLTSTLRRALNGSFLTRAHESKAPGFSDAHISKKPRGSGPFTILATPIFSELRNISSDLVGFAYSVFGWDRLLMNLVPFNVAGIHAVLRNTAGQSFTFELHGSETAYLGEGDLHDTNFDSSAVVTPFASFRGDSDILCEYTVILYSSKEFQSHSTSALPVTVTCCIALSFAVFMFSFLMYDHFVRRKSDVVADLATRSLRILSTLFPTNVRERMFADGLKEQHRGRVKVGEYDDGNGDLAMMGATKNLKTYLDDIGDDDDDEEQLGYAGRSIADLFPQTTVMFADIAGFTAWSTAHSPAEVFSLLETLYGSFDEISQRRRVFKVETVGDCYVAVSGVPEPEKNHAVVMSRFARDCMYRMRYLTRKLEVTLGPDTGDLSLRAGLHSGPVTAGVLRGERSRFQLFGDTMNTAARMEGSGLKGRIQISQDTADCLIELGKENWFTPRTDMKVVAKGIGEIKTYWLCLGSESDFGLSPLPSTSRAPSEREADITHVSNIELFDEARTLSISSEKVSRLIDWNVETLLHLLKRIVASRKLQGKPGYRTERTAPYEQEFGSVGLTSVVEEVKEVIPLPQKDSLGALNDGLIDSITLPPEVVEQLYAFVTSIAALYNTNPFHSFEHASHVTMSVVKLLSRIVAPNLVDMIGKTLHDHTYGITSDPLTQFACVFSALIHDVDHKGVPNAQLVKENSALAQFYNHQSPAEQNSIDLSWQLLMDPAYDELRKAIYTEEEEYRRFRQLVVNSVMATDIVDKDLKMLRNARWAKAFRSDSPNDEENPTSSVAINRKATIVIEHLIQASDVAHTMQHWHIYRKWNERFFFECYKAYLEGRADKNPAEGWYQGEIGFYDFYIVPLARKLKDCGVFGVSSDEYLNYAVRNRREWENKGREVVLEMVEKANKELGVRASNADSTELMQALQADISASTSHSLNKTSHVRYGDH